MADSSVPITAGSGTPIRVLTALGAGSAGQQVVTIGDLYGNLERHGPDGTLSVSPEASSLFLDDFSGTLSATHTTGGTAPTASTGIVTANSGTTASATSYMRSVSGFLLRAGSYLRIAWNAKVDTAAVTNSTRWFGYGLNAATPTATAPIANGIVFEVAAADGLLYAVTYAAGTRTQVAALTRPTDGNYHRYELWFRQSALYWLLDGTVVASISISSPSFPQLTQIQNLATIFGAANASTAPTSAPVLQATSVTVTDQSGFHRGIADATNPAVQATVKPASTAVAATDTALAVGMHPNSPLPAGTNALGSVTVTGTPTVSVTGTNTPTLAAGNNLAGAVAIGATAPSASYYTSTTTNAATVAKSSAGNLQALLITNTGTGVQYVKLFNATTVTLGTTAAIADIAVPASGTPVILNLGPNGLRFTTGIAYAVTGALGTTNNTAGAGGVLIAATYV